MNRLVKIIGLAWLVWVALNLYRAILNIFTVLPKREIFDKLISDPPEKYSNTIEFLSPFMSNIHYFVYGHLIFFLFSAFIGLYFLKYRRWTLKILNILVLLNIAFFLLLLFMSFGFSSAVAADGYSLRHGYLGFISTIGGMLVFLGALAFLLRTKKVTIAFEMK